MTPEQIEQLKAILEFDYYGISLSTISALCVVVLAVAFLFSARQERSFMGRVFDLLLVFVSIALLIGCIWAGMTIGNQHEKTGWGFAGGVFVFWFCFYIVSTIRTKIRNKESRKRLAEQLARK